MPDPWQCVSAPGEMPHVHPLNDHRPHELSQDCWCRPRCEVDIWVHNSMDGREDYETGRLRLN